MTAQVTKLLKSDWQKIINDQAQSGLSQTAYCRQHGIDLTKFVYYRSKIKELNKSIDENSAEFKPIKITSNAGDDIKIFLPNGFHFVFGHMADVTQIKKIIEILLLFV